MSNGTKATSTDYWKDCQIGITGANGRLGKALTKIFRKKGAFVVGFTHGSIPSNQQLLEEPQEWIQWQCGEESSLKHILKELDVLILNHGVNLQGKQTPKDFNAFAARHTAT